MKKETLNLVKTIHGYGTGHFKNLEGKLLTFLEALGLSETQEKAIKDLVRNEIWNMWEHPSFIEQKELEDGFCPAVLQNSD